MTNKAPQPKQDPARKASVEAAYNAAFEGREDVGDDPATLRAIEASKARRQARTVDYHKRMKAASGTAAAVTTK